MTHAVFIDAHGGPDMLALRSHSVGDPGPGDVRLRHTAIGLNYIDTYHRTGLYPLADLPQVIGLEAAGRVTAVGDNVSDLNVGDRVAYATVLGAYSEERVAPADRLVKIPEAISDQTAAAMMLQGMTVEYLLRRTFQVGPETTLLFHAAAGGVGLIACQWAAQLGATVIGTVGSDEKAELARAHGCTHTINYRSEDFAARVAELTDGTGCDVVYDGIGAATFPASLDCLRPRGMWVSFGNASGPVPAFELGILSAKGSLFATRPSLMAYVATRDELAQSAAALFDGVQSGAVKISVNQTYALRDAATAHRDLEARKTTGSTLLLP